MNYSNQNHFDESALKFEFNEVTGLTGFGKEMNYLEYAEYILTSNPNSKGFFYGYKSSVIKPF